MTKVKIEIDCLKDLLKREPIVKIVEELPAKETADLNYIYVVPKEGEGKDTKAYVLRPDRSGYDAIDLTPQIVSVLGEGYITVEKETLNENGDVTFTVKTNETLANVLKELENKDKEQDAKLTDVTNRVKALEDKPEPPHEANMFFAKGDIIGIGTETDIRITRDELVNADTIKVGDTVVDHYWDNKVFNTGMFKVVSIDGDNIVLNGVNNINYKHPKQELTLTGNELSISDGNSVTLPSGTAYNDTELKEQVNDLGSSIASVLHDISEIRVNNEARLTSLESKEDKDKQTLSLEGNVLSISNGNSVTLPTSSEVDKPMEVKFLYPVDDVSYINSNINKFLDDNDENFKEGRIEVLSKDAYPTMLRYKDSDGKVFRLSNGLSFGSVDNARVGEDYFFFNNPFDGEHFYVSMSGTIMLGTEFVAIPTFNMHYNFENNTRTKFVYNETISPVEIMCTPSQHSNGETHLELLCKSYVDGNTHITRLRKAEGTDELSAKVPIKYNGNIVEVTITIPSPMITLGV